MTDFHRIELTIAETGAGKFIGFDVERAEWDDVLDRLHKSNAGKPVHYTKGSKPRNEGLSEEWMWVWIEVRNDSPLELLLCITDMAFGIGSEIIKPKPNEFP